MTFPNIFIRRIREFGFEGAIYPIHPSADDDRRAARLPQPRRHAGAGGLRVHRRSGRADTAAARGSARARALRAGDLERLRRGGRRQGAAGRARRRGARGRHAPHRPQLPRHVLPPRRDRLQPRPGPEDGGHVGAISQSGGLGTDIVRRGITRGLRYSGVVTVGNCADVGPERSRRVLSRRRANARHRHVHRVGR